MKSRIKITAVLLSLLIINLSVAQSYCATLNCEIFSDNGGVFLARHSGRKVFVYETAPYSSSYTYTLPSKALDCSVINKTAYILAENSNEKNAAYLYTAKNGSINNPLTLRNVKVNNFSKICADNSGNIYIKTKSDNIIIYNKKGKQIKSLSEKAEELIPFKNYILAYNSKKLYLINADSIISFTNPSKKLLYRISDDYIADIDGQVYKIGNNLSRKTELNQSGFFQITESDKYFIACTKNSITAYNKSDGKHVGEVKTESEPLAVTRYKNNIAVIFGSSGSYSSLLINEKEFEKTTSASKSSSANINKYRHTKKYIFINQGTTIEEFLSNISANGCTVEFEHRKSGRIKTGNIVNFKTANSIRKYIFIVKGDVTGEGNVNSRDEAAMFNHLLGIKKLTGINKLAGDLNKDKKLSNSDLVLLSRIIYN